MSNGKYISAYFWHHVVWDWYFNSYSVNKNMYIEYCLFYCLILYNTYYEFEILITYKDWNILFSVILGREHFYIYSVWLS